MPPVSSISEPNPACSPSAGACSWTPTGRPLWLFPAGSEMAGIPARLAPTVNKSQRYIWIGSSIFSPIANAGAGVTGFEAGDRVYYAGDLTRPGTNSELHLVNERIVGHKPKSLGFAEAAALPLTAITAWEMLFDHLDITQQPIPVVPAAHYFCGGVLVDLWGQTSLPGCFNPSIEPGLGQCAVTTSPVSSSTIEPAGKTPIRFAKALPRTGS